MSTLNQVASYLATQAQKQEDQKTALMMRALSAGLVTGTLDHKLEDVLTSRANVQLLDKYVKLIVNSWDGLGGLDGARSCANHFVFTQ